MHWIGIIAGIAIVLASVFFFPNNNGMMMFLIGIGAGVMALPFVINISLENKKEQKINEMFLEFSRNLAEGVSTGTPISKAIVNSKKKNYGYLSPYVEKLSNQIELGIPIGEAMQNFANDTNAPIIKRATALIREAERAGGEIDYILESTAKSISEVEKLKKERKSAIYSLAVQGYIIFFIFIGIILIMQFKIIPLTSGMGNLGSFTGTGDFDLDDYDPDQPSDFSAEEFTRPFIYLLLTQGFFVGLVIGKLTEGSVKKGLKHSFILMITAFLISTGANLFVSAPAPV